MHEKKGWMANSPLVLRRAGCFGGCLGGCFQRCTVLPPVLPLCCFRIAEAAKLNA
uniref:Uncharacterized protein n=1 Tax=Burkholderia sp. (strain CCGE1003) TaxID=640512 RepID=E1TAL9_BURSG